MGSKIIFILFPKNIFWRGSLHPFFDDWKLLRDEESLTDNSDHMDVQVIEIDAFDDKILLKIHDSQTWMTSKLSKEWREDLWAIMKNCIFSLQKTTGGPENLLIVSKVLSLSLLLSSMLLWSFCLHHCCHCHCCCHNWCHCHHCCHCHELLLLSSLLSLPL